MLHYDARKHLRLLTNITCKITDTHYGLSETGRILDLSKKGARVEINSDTFFKSSKSDPVAINFRGNTIISTISRSWEYKEGFGVGVIFNEEIPDEEFNHIVEMFKRDENDLSGVIIFNAQTAITDLTYLEMVQQLAFLYIVIDASYWIYTHIYSKTKNEDILLSPPRFLYLRSNSPVEGAVNTAKEIVAIVESVDTIFRNRTENINKENDKTKHSSEIAAIIELKKDELTFLKKSLGFTEDTTHDTKEVFADGSEELKLLQSRLLPHFSALTNSGRMSLKLIYTDIERVDF